MIQNRGTIDDEIYYNGVINHTRTFVPHSISRFDDVTLLDS